MRRGDSRLIIGGRGDEEELLVQGFGMGACKAAIALATRLVARVDSFCRATGHGLDA